MLIESKSKTHSVRMVFLLILGKLLLKKTLSKIQDHAPQPE
jgi:hypothetical protein